MKVVTLAVVVSTLLVTDARWTTHPPTGQPGQDLTGKMFTLSQNDGGVIFYPGSYTPPWASTRSYSTYPTTSPSHRTTSPFPWTTETPVRGISVCVRYMADTSDFVNIFTLDKYSSNLQLTQTAAGSYTVTNNYFWVSMTTKFKLWPITQWNMWTSVCLTVDNSNSVTQLFKDFSMSVRLLLPSRLRRLSKPLIEFPGFNGQITDLQVWDYPLSYKEVYTYMRRDGFRPYRGSLLTWSNINYSNKENSLLEDEYGVLAQQAGGGGKGGRPRKRKFNAEESQQTKGRLII